MNSSPTSLWNWRTPDILPNWLPFQFMAFFPTHQKESKYLHGKVILNLYYFHMIIVQKKHNEKLEFGYTYMECTLRYTRPLTWEVGRKQLLGVGPLPMSGVHAQVQMAFFEKLSRLTKISTISIKQNFQSTKLSKYRRKNIPTFIMASIFTL